MQKPSWLNKKIDLAASAKVKRLLKGLSLHTVCQESLCPNISECFSHNAATFMILGNICTRQCQFCNVKKATPTSIDHDEPQRVKEAVGALNLKYVVITSPTRDDLDDGGASVFADTVKKIKDFDPNIKVETLIPDFLGDEQSVEIVANSSADVISHNLETVSSLYAQVRKGADYTRSLRVLRLLKEKNSNIYTKSGLMLGLGETQPQLLHTLGDLRMVGCDFLTLGQYLPPSVKHFPLKEYISPEKFLFFEKKAIKLGFKAVKSSPYTRSSYFAHTFLAKNN